MDELQDIKNFINLYGKRRDRTKACNAARVSTTVLRTALRKTRFAELTEGEVRAIKKLRKIIMARLEDIKENMSIQPCNS